MLIRDVERLPVALRTGAVTIGNFDGVHCGHARIVDRLVARAREVGGPAVVFTFDPHPARLLRPDAVPARLSWTARKAELLGELGVDAVVAYPTDRELLDLTAEEFFQRFIRGRLDAKAVVEGPNFHFGRARSGSIDRLRELCRQAGILFEIVQPLEVDGRCVSSSWIRELIEAGRIAEANRLLIRPYRIRGQVVHGAGRGTGLGFPTANLEPEDMVVPPLGVYAGCADWNGDRIPAAVNIGANPTFGEQQIKIEVHLIGFDQPLYGRHLEIDLLDRLRDVRLFDSVAALQTQLASDVEMVRRIVNESDRRPQTADGGGDPPS